MKALFLLAGAAALGISAPAAARPDHGHHAKHHAQHRAVKRAQRREHRAEHRAHRAERRVEHYRARDYDRHLHRVSHHHRAHFYRGQRYRPGYATYYSYNRIPWRYRHEYRLTDRYRYYYSDGYVYVVDPRTMLIQQVIAALF
jgi:hypothetical protein